MNKIIFLSLVFLFFSVNDSFGVTQTELGDDLFIFVQSSIRDSDGVLVVYLESTKFTDLNLPALDTFLDFEATRGNDPAITINGEQFQVIRRVQSHSFDSEELVASTILADTVDGKPTILARFAHDGYVTIPGDTLESMWTFVRPVA